MTREEAHAKLRANRQEGWLPLVDILYDNRPPQVEIEEVFQKWGGLKTDLDGEDERFEELADQVYYLSAYMCERCGHSARTTVIDGWETALCRAHFEAEEAAEKYWPEKKTDNPS